MATSMHRLQVSLPEWQVQFLTARARRDGVSIAEVIRQLVEREAATPASDAGTDSLWEIVGLAEDHGPLVYGIPVSERPDLYLAEQTAPYAKDKRRASRKRGARKSSRR